ncbi:SDR family NAD(P)-dependent oxidoreductase [Poriferisphaera sp. WC338]|uniref:SDR family NAD(P)-dependent oxidoreductase n=1 Tax=Poriferisphaera sp. WC338 TaxID=3425129 RepID=UPI003D8126C5
MKKAIVIGASSGIGKGMAIKLHRQGYTLGITARRTELLDKLNHESLNNTAIVQHMDLTNTEASIHALDDLINQLGGLDLVIISSGVGKADVTADWKESKQMIDVNVTGFTAVADTALTYFIKQNHGHIVGLSSIAGLRGMGPSAVYSATKGFERIYLEGVQQDMHQQNHNIHVTAVMPGFIDTPMIEDNKHTFWVQPVDKTCNQIYRAIQRKKFSAIVTRRWKLFALLIRLIPQWLWLHPKFNHKQHQANDSPSSN